MRQETKVIQTESVTLKHRPHLLACFSRELQNRGSRTYSLAYAHAVLVNSCGLRDPETNSGTERLDERWAEKSTPETGYATTRG